MPSGEVVIESMWSPAVALLVGAGHHVRYAAPPEGFRGWAGGHAISHVAERSEPAAGVLRLHQLVAHGRGRRDHDAPGLLQRRPGDEPRVRRAGRVGVLDRRARQPPRTCRPPARTAASRSDSVRDGGSFADARLQLQHLELATWTRRSTRSSAGTSSSPPRLRRTRMPEDADAREEGRRRPPPPPPAGPAPGLELTSLTKASAADVVAVDDVNLTSSTASTSSCSGPRAAARRRRSG